MPRAKKFHPALNTLQTRLLQAMRLNGVRVIERVKATKGAGLCYRDDNFVGVDKRTMKVLLRGKYVTKQSAPTPDLVCIYIATDPPCAATHPWAVVAYRHGVEVALTMYTTEAGAFKALDRFESYDRKVNQAGETNSRYRYSVRPSTPEDKEYS